MPEDFDTKHFPGKIAAACVARLHLSLTCGKTDFVVIPSFNVITEAFSFINLFTKRPLSRLGFRGKSCDSVGTRKISTAILLVLLLAVSGHSVTRPVSQAGGR
jgi:hypothetical protein